MAANKDPYKKLQKRFVQARAGGVEYEDLTPEQREQFRNRFNTLAQTVEGRGKIARRILGPEAPQEQVRAVRQRIRKNLPSTGTGTGTGTGTTPEDFAPAGPTITNTRLIPTSSDILNMRAGYRAQGAAIDANRRAAAAPTTTVTTKKDKGSDRIGSGFWSIPKNPVQALKEIGQGFQAQVDYVNRAYVNPVINLAGSAADVIGGRKGEQKFKPLPVLTKQEIALDAAITALTAGASLAAKPAIASSATTLGALGTGLTRRGAVGLGTAVTNISERQANLALIRAAAEMQEASALSVRQAIAEGGDTFMRGKVPGGTTVPRNPPKSSGLVKSPTATVTTTKAATQTTAKEVVGEVAAKPITVVSQKVTTQQIEAAAESYAGKGRNLKSLEFPGQGPTKSKGASFTQEFGDIEMTSTAYEPSPVVERAAPVRNVPAPKVETVGPKKGGKTSPKSNKKVKPISVEPLPTPKVTTSQIEASTEAYTPGFSKEFGDIEMRSTIYEPLDVPKPASPAAEIPAPTFGPSPQQREKALKVAEENLEFVRNARAEMEQAAKQTQPLQGAPTPTTATKATRKVSQKKSLAAVSEPASPAAVSAEDIEFLRMYPSSQRGQEIYRRMANIKEYTPPTGTLPLPQQTVRPGVVEPSRSEVLARQWSEWSKQSQIERMAAFPDFEPRKVTKLPRRDPALDRLEARGSMLFRMYDEGAGSRARPSGAIETGAQRGIPVQTQLDDVIDMMQGGGSGQFRSGEIAVGSKDVQKEIERTMVQPNVVIKRGESINPRYTRRTQPTKSGEMPMPTTMSKGVEEFKPTRMPLDTQRGKSLQQRLNDELRQMYPQARSIREARKLYEEEMGVPPSLRQLTSGYTGGNPQGPGALRTPRVDVTRQKPVAYEKTVNAKGETVYKPIAFEEEVVPGIMTTSGAVPLDELPQRWIVSPDVIEQQQKARKARTLRSRAEQAARLRERGIQGEKAGAELQRQLDDIKKGKAFQRRFNNLTEKK